MINFGTSAYLRIILQNPKPMETAIKSRASKVKKRQHDYHASLRRAVKNYVENPSEIDAVFLKLNAIKNKSEKKSAIEGLNSTIKFLEMSDGKLFVPEEKIVKHYSERFAVKFQPNFGIEKNGIRISIHLWNTKAPLINRRGIQAVLGLFLNQYSSNERPAILCLKTMTLYYGTGTSIDQKIASAFLERIAILVEKYSEIDQSDEDRKTG